MFTLNRWSVNSACLYFSNDQFHSHAHGYMKLLYLVTELEVSLHEDPGILLYAVHARIQRRYIVTSSLIGWTHDAVAANTKWSLEILTVFCWFLCILVDSKRPMSVTSIKISIDMHRNVSQADWQLFFEWSQIFLLFHIIVIRKLKKKIMHILYIWLPKRLQYVILLHNLYSWWQGWLWNTVVLANITKSCMC